MVCRKNIRLGMSFHHRKATGGGFELKETVLVKTVTVVVDRPLGSCHPKYPNLYYSVNYGYVCGIIAPDGKEQDAYILG